MYSWPQSGHSRDHQPYIEVITNGNEIVTHAPSPAAHLHAVNQVCRAAGGHHSGGASQLERVGVRNHGASGQLRSRTDARRWVVERA